MLIKLVLQQLEKQVQFGWYLEETAYASIGRPVNNRAHLALQGTAASRLHHEHLFKCFLSELPCEINVFQDASVLSGVLQEQLLLF